MPDIKEKYLDESNTVIDGKRKLILYNSSHYWETVIIQLKKATGYDEMHCEQIALIAHTRGKAVVKTGVLEELQKINKVLSEISLVTSIE